MRRLAAIVALCAVAGQAAALSCTAPDPIRTFRDVDASDARWGAVIGRLDFDESRLSRTARDSGEFRPPPRTDLAAQLVGHSLTQDGWTKPFQGNVTLRVQCFSQWCGDATSGARYLLFLKREGDGLVAFADPCGAYIFAPPGSDTRDALQRCFNGGPCEPNALP